MPSAVPLEEAQTKLRELIENLAPGEEILIIQGQQPVARLVGEHRPRAPRPAPGLGKGSILHMSPDFDEPLEEFKEYME